MIEHDIRAECAHGAVEGLCRKTFQKSVRSTVFAHAVDNIRPRRMLFEHGVNRVDIVLQIRIHADRHIRMRQYGHQSREQGILMSLVVREIDPGKDGTAFRALNDQLPCTVTAAVVDKGDAAPLAHPFRFDQLREFFRKFSCGIEEHFLLVIAGHDEVEDRRRHLLSSLKIQSPSRCSTSCQFSAPSSCFILLYIKSRIMMYFGRASARSAASESAWFVSASIPGMSV